MMQMARLKLSNKDQEAMRRMRAKMEGSPDWHGGASVGGSPVKVDERVRVPEPIPEAGPSRVCLWIRSRLMGRYRRLNTTIPLWSSVRRAWGSQPLSNGLSNLGIVNL